MDWNQLLSTKREHSAEASHNDDTSRSEFHKDYDRIVFSSAFRRLGRKTQVHPLSNHDHIHTRLTHSIEVGSVGRSLGNKIGAFLHSRGELPSEYSPDDIGTIVQAACLAHDIGNPPFGHAGEFAIRHWFKENTDLLLLTTAGERSDLTIFEGNAQGLRVVSRVEDNLNEGGLRLTYTTLACLIKYPWFSDNALASSKGKFNFFQSEKELVHKLADELGLWHGTSIMRHPLSYLMEAADDICYKILDIEDALELGMLDFKRVEKIFSHLAGASEVISSPVPSQHTLRKRIVPLRAKAIENLIEQAVEAFEENYDDIMNGNFQGDLIARLTGNEKIGLDDAKDITTNNIFLSRRKIELELGAYSIMETILESFVIAIKELHSESPIHFKSKRVIDLMGANKITSEMTEYECYMRVMDMVSGMTDNHAVHIANQLSGRAI
ncbi:deoxyguanosinetriphosphate triphosphohydrolase [Vibrio sp. D3]|uniref:deoxyguanosinetriphosphate triphosphohydrolase n=1 Tax=Vibrio sp. D3 TaxID=3374281 RepID=UPI0037575076